MNLLSWSIVIVFALSVWHIVYEGIVLPSLRLKLRFRLFELRDRLRALKTDCPEQCSDAAFHQLDDSLSWQMDNHHKVTASMFVDVEMKYNADQTFAASVANRTKVLDSCQLPEYNSIRRERELLYVEALAFNTGGWLIYFIPVLIALFAWDKISEAAKRLVAMSDRQLEEAAPKLA